MVWAGRVAARTCSTICAVLRLPSRPMRPAIGSCAVTASPAPRYCPPT
jgi:hypothetical protein